MKKYLIAFLLLIGFSGCTTDKPENYEKYLAEAQSGKNTIHVNIYNKVKSREFNPYSTMIGTDPYLKDGIYLIISNNPFLWVEHGEFILQFFEPLIPLKGTLNNVRNKAVMEPRKHYSISDGDGEALYIKLYDGKKSESIKAEEAIIDDDEDTSLEVGGFYKFIDGKVYIDDVYKNDENMEVASGVYYGTYEYIGCDKKYAFKENPQDLKDERECNFLPGKLKLEGAFSNRRLYEQK